jgi:hypothetical protein
MSLPTVNKESLFGLANLLATAASVFAPSSAIAIKAVVEAAKKLNEMVSAIHDQTKDTQPEVWKEIHDDYLESRNDMLRSFERNPGR